MSLLKRGLSGEPVRRLQEALGITADGAFGPGTEQAVRDYQAANGLVVDGIAGPDTFTSLGLHELVLLRIGSRGDAVRRMQESLGIDADGIFGSGTAAAVKAFQEANGLTGDGMAGPVTLAELAPFQQTHTVETIAAAELPPEMVVPDPEPLPELKGTEFVKSKAASVLAPAKSVWNTVKGWFS